MPNQPPANIMSKFPKEGSSGVKDTVSEKSVPGAKSSDGSLKGYPVDQVKAHTGKMTE